MPFPPHLIEVLKELAPELARISSHPHTKLRLGSKPIERFNYRHLCELVDWAEKQ